MEIQQQLYRAIQTHERSEQLREGELSKATLIERVHQNEAILSIRGREVRAVFDGDVPKADRITIEVLEKNGDVIRVRTVTEEHKAQGELTAKGNNNELTQTLRQLGVSQPTAELRQAALMITEKGMALTKEAVQELQRFLADGNKFEKLETIQALANKRLEITATHLRSVHEALHGRPLNEVLGDLAREFDQNFKIESHVRENGRDHQRSQMEILQQAKELIRREGINERTVAIVQNETSRLSQREQTAIAQALKDAQSLASKGESQRAIDRVVQVLIRLEQNSVKEQDHPERLQANKNEQNQSASVVPQRALPNRTASSDQVIRMQIIDQLQQLERSVAINDRAAIQEMKEALLREPLFSRGIEQVRAILDRSDRSPSSETVQKVQGILFRAEQVQAHPTTTQDQSTQPEKPVQVSGTGTQQARTEQTQIKADIIQTEQRSQLPIPNEAIRQIQQEVQRTEQIVRAAEVIRQQLAGQSQISKQAIQFIERAVAEASHLDKIGRERIEQVLGQLEKNVATEQDRTVIRELRALIEQGAPLAKMVQNGLHATQLTSEEAKQQIDKALIQAQQLEQVGRERMLLALAKIEQQLFFQDGGEEQQDEKSLADMLKQAQVGMQKEANFTRALEQVQSIFNHPALAEQDRSTLNEAVNLASKQMEQGRELAARKQVMQTLEQLEQAVRPQEVYEQNEQWQTSVEMASKAIAVTTVTEKLAQAATEFKALQRDITRTLDVVTRQIEHFRAQAQTQVKPLLETVIKKLDNAILRSDMMLLTDMKTEKRLMQASGQLAEAKKLLVKGNYQAANQIVKEVKQLVERLNFQPSETKVKHYVALNDRQGSSSSFPHQYSETMRYSAQDGSARGMFELIRGLGLNRDSELANQLASNRALEGQSDMKSALMKLLQSEEEGSRTGQLANQALTNVTGQQLLSRSDQQGTMQNMFFNLPFLLEEKVENLQVFVNSRSGGGHVDWENCQLYFLIETPRLGEIGIMVQAVERQLSITLKNDQQDFQAKMNPLVDAAVGRLADIGYAINGIKYAKLGTNEQTQTQDQSERAQRPIFTKEGFDFKI